jgi:cupin 2 domain-containing protein
MTVQSISGGNSRQTGNIFADIPKPLPAELFETLLQTQSVRIERIVSKGHVTPEDAWYDQNWDEWVLLIQGAAALLFEDNAETLELRGGDYVFIPAHRRHRVVWTDPRRETIWLAVHLASGDNAGNAYPHFLMRSDPCHPYTGF